MDEPNQLSEEGVGKIVLGVVHPRTERRKMAKAIGEGEIPLLLPSELTKHDPNIGPHVLSIRRTRRRPRQSLPPLPCGTPLSQRQPWPRKQFAIYCGIEASFHFINQERAEAGCVKMIETKILNELKICIFSLAFIHSQQKQTSLLLDSSSIVGCMLEYIHFAERSEGGWLDIVMEVGEKWCEEEQMEALSRTPRTRPRPRCIEGEREGFVFLAFFPSIGRSPRFNIPDNGYKSTFRPFNLPYIHRTIHPSTSLHSRPLPHLPHPKAYIWTGWREF